MRYWSRGPRKHRDRNAPCGKRPGGKNCRWAAPGIHSKNGGKYALDSPAYCGGCHVDRERSAGGLGVRRQMAEAKRLSVQQEKMAVKKPRKPRAKKPTEAKSPH